MISMPVIVKHCCDEILLTIQDSADELCKADVFFLLDVIRKKYGERCRSCGRKFGWKTHSFLVDVFIGRAGLSTTVSKVYCIVLES